MGEAGANGKGFLKGLYLTSPIPGSNPTIMERGKTMKSEQEIRAEITKVEAFCQSMPWWDDDKNIAQTILDTLLWVVGDGNSLCLEEK